MHVSDWLSYVYECTTYQSVTNLAQVFDGDLRLEELTDTSLDYALVQSLAEHDLGVVFNVEFCGNVLHGALLQLGHQVAHTKSGHFVDQTSDDLALSLFLLHGQTSVLANIAAYDVLTLRSGVQTTWI